MKKVAARILYEQIRAMNPEGGLYVWTVPDEHSILQIQSLIKDAPFKTESSTEYHATVLYHIGDLPEDAVMPDDYACSATINEIVSWPDKNGTVTVVALLDSPDLQDIHGKLLEQGLTHTFPKFAPHVTVGVKAEENPALRLWLDETNAELSEKGIPIGFDLRLRGALNEDA
jgi:2'-5' RNA ligase